MSHQFIFASDKTKVKPVWWFVSPMDRALSTKEILEQLTAGTITQEEAHTMISELTKSKVGVTWEISDKKDCIVFRGIRKQYPVSLYLSQVNALRDAITSDEFQTWVKANSDRLNNPKGQAYLTKK